MVQPFILLTLSLQTVEPLVQESPLGDSSNRRLGQLLTPRLAACFVQIPRESSSVAAPFEMTMLTAFISATRAEVFTELKCIITASDFADCAELLLIYKGWMSNIYIHFNTNLTKQGRTIKERAEQTSVKSF